MSGWRVSMMRRRRGWRSEGRRGREQWPRAHQEQVTRGSQALLLNQFPLYSFRAYCFSLVPRFHSHSTRSRSSTSPLHLHCPLPRPLSASPSPSRFIQIPIPLLPALHSPPSLPHPDVLPLTLHSHRHSLSVGTPHLDSPSLPLSLHSDLHSLSFGTPLPSTLPLPPSPARRSPTPHADRCPCKRLTAPYNLSVCLSLCPLVDL